MNTKPAPSTATLLLRGGHRWTIDAGPDGTLLRELMRLMPAPGRASKATLVLRSVEGQTLRVAAQEIVGIIADGPAAEVLKTDPAPPAPFLRANTTLPASPFFQIENFLTPDEWSQVLTFALAKEKDYAAATVTTADAQYRRAQVLYEPQALLPFFRPKIEALLPSAWGLLAMPPEPVKNIESQITAHGEGDYFKRHNDNGSSTTAGRVLSYVYYFHREPKKFSGGHLRMFETVIADGVYQCGAQSAEVEPRNNSLVMFPSYCHHEVTPVQSESALFADRRFTLNGWVVRQ